MPLEISIFQLAAQDERLDLQTLSSKKNWMEVALLQARAAEQAGEVPVGAVLVHEGQILAQSGNRVRTQRDPTAHAEMLVLQEGARKLCSERLSSCDLYVTLEPCVMCAAALSYARIRRLYFGAHNPKEGAVESGLRWFQQASCHHAPQVYSGIYETEAICLLQKFFQKRR